MRNGQAMFASALIAVIAGTSYADATKPKFAADPAAPAQPEAATIETLAQVGGGLQIEDFGAWHHATVGDDPSGGYFIARARRVETADATRIWVDFTALRGRAGGEPTPESFDRAMRYSEFTSISPDDADSLLRFIEELEKLELRDPDEVVRTRTVSAFWRGTESNQTLPATITEDAVGVEVSFEPIGPPRVGPTHLSCPPEAIRQAIEPALRDARAMQDAEALLRLNATVVVVGLFDTNGDSEWTPEERVQVQDALRQRGAQIMEDVNSRVDLVIVGKRPRTHAAPQPGTTIEEMSRWQQMDRASRRYETALTQAGERSIRVMQESDAYRLLNLPRQMSTGR